MHHHILYEHLTKHLLRKKKLEDKRNIKIDNMFPLQSNVHSFYESQANINKHASYHHITQSRFL